MSHKKRGLVIPSIRNIETVELIADNYCANSQNKTKAMVDAGYSPKYADTGHGHRIVFGNVRVKAAISKKMAELKAETVATRQQRQLFWTSVYKDTSSNMSDRLRASELLGKSEADFTENINTNTDQQRLLSEQEAAEARRIAIIANREALRQRKGA